MKDTQAPQIGYCPDENIIIEVGPSEFGAAITFNEPWFYDDCEMFESADSVQLGDWLAAGQTTEVSISAEDNGGNITTCVFSVSVIDPFLNFPDQTIEVSIPNGSSFNTNDVDWNQLFAKPCGECNEIESDTNFQKMYRYLGELNGHRYFVTKDEVLPTDIGAATSRFAGYAATISSFEENRFLSNELIDDSALLGLTDSQLEGSFVWEDGNALTYQNWAAGQPLAAGTTADTTDFVIINANGEWENVASQEYHLVLEIPCYDVKVASSNLPQGNQAPYGDFEVRYSMEDICGNLDSTSVFVKVVDETVPYAYPNENPSKIDSDTHHYLSGIYLDGFTSLSGNNMGYNICLLYTSPSPRDATLSRMPSSA